MKESFIKKYCAGCGCCWRDADESGTPICTFPEPFGGGDPISTLPACPRGKDYPKRLRRASRKERRARNRKKLPPRKRQLLRDLRVGLIAGLVAGIVYLIEFVTLK